MSEITIYSSNEGSIQLEVKLSGETVWLSLNQISQLFGRNKSVISRHLSNIFKINELTKDSVVAKFATTAADEKIYQVDYYNLDAIISVGYRVNSKEGVRFRKWASQVLKEHLIKGYSIYEKRLKEIGLKDLQQTIELLNKTLVNHQLVNDLGSEVMQLIISYAKTWSLLLAYDEDRLEIPQESRKKTTVKLNYEVAVSAITSLKIDLSSRGEATPLFGHEREKGLKNIIMNIDQTFSGKPLYQSVEEKGAHLLYFIIKDHPFTDGNKRIGSFIFLLYLKLQKIHFKVSDNGLVALALLIAESSPSQKDIMIRLISNMLVN